MEVQVSEETQEVEDQITYLYKYVQEYWLLGEWYMRDAYSSNSFRPGRSNKSFGTMYVLVLLYPHHTYSKSIDLPYSCAAINGIDPAIVSRANEIASLSARGENIVAACAVLSSEEMQVLEEAV